MAMSRLSSMKLHWEVSPRRGPCGSGGCWRCGSAGRARGRTWCPPPCRSSRPGPRGTAAPAPPRTAAWSRGIRGWCPRSRAVNEPSRKTRLNRRLNKVSRHEIETLIHKDHYGCTVRLANILKAVLYDLCGQFTRLNFMSTFVLKCPLNIVSK